MITAGTGFGVDDADPDTVDPDPVGLMLRWLPAADEPGTLLPLAVLSTTDLDGTPDSRHLLVSSHDREGLTFHTDLASRKVAELGADPRASLALAWPERGRQLVVRGDVAPLSAAEAATAYRHRSRYLQLLAWQNRPDVAALAQEQRRSAWAAFAAEHPPGTLDPPPSWGGFRLHPRVLVFWRGDPDGPSIRHRYTRAGDGWIAEVVPG